MNCELTTGTRVRVAFEGVVVTPSRVGDWTWVKPDGEHQGSRVPIGACEVLLPRREFEDGAYYLTPDGSVYQYRAVGDDFYSRNSTYVFCRDDMASDHELAALVKLVPETESA